MKNSNKFHEDDLDTVYDQHNQDMTNYTGQGRDLSHSESIASMLIGIGIMIITAALVWHLNH